MVRRMFIIQVGQWAEGLGLRVLGLWGFRALGV